MRKIIEKRHLYFFLAAILGIGLAIFVTAYGTSNPSSFGHSVKELGVHTNDGCSVGQVLRVDSTGTKIECATVSGGSGGWTDGGASVYLTTSTDNVGIGTSSFVGKLSVLTTAGESGFTSGFYQTSEQSTSGKLYFETDGSPWKFQIGSLDTAHNNAWIPGITIMTNGDVGIGTTSPTEKLEVVGKVKATNTLKTYVGATTQTYDGAGVGGYSGGNAKCNAQFPGSRMCMAADFSNGLPTQSGWYNSYTTSDAGARDIEDCRGWSTNTDTSGGPVWDTTPNSPIYQPCNTQQVKILCCS